jgi:hypothetical protein
MADHIIRSISIYDARFPLPAGAGTNSIHATSEYCLAITLLSTDGGPTGSGFVLTLRAHLAKHRGPDALRMCHELSKFRPLWIEEPVLRNLNAGRDGSIGDSDNDRIAV